MQVVRICFIASAVAAPLGGLPSLLRMLAARSFGPTKMASIPGTEKIESALKDARTKLLENFDDEVQRKLRLRSQETRNSLSRYGDWLWRLTQHELAKCATFEDEGLRFDLYRVPAGLPTVTPSPGASFTKRRSASYRSGSFDSGFS